jgi:predicted dehydrogenase
VTLDLATHDIDVMRYLLGDEVARVYAETDQRRTRRPRTCSPAWCASAAG